MRHVIAPDDLEVELRNLVRTGHRIDALILDGDHWVAITEDQIETRSVA